VTAQVMMTFWLLAIVPPRDFVFVQPGATVDGQVRV